jgi:hypothetical protein
VLPHAGDMFLLNRGMIAMMLQFLGRSRGRMNSLAGQNFERRRYYQLL